MKQLIGKVTSTKMDKSVTVEVVRIKVHPLYKKRMRRKKKYLVHDETGVKLGQKVKIQECRPLSKRKRWKIAEVIKEKGKKN